MRLGIGSVGLVVVHVLFWGAEATASVFYCELFPTRERAHAVAALGLLNTTVPYTLYAVAAEYGLDVSIMAVLSGTSPFFAALLASTFVPGSSGAEPLCSSTRRAVGVALGLVGGFLIACRKQIEDGGVDGTSAAGVVAQLVAVASKSAAAVLAEHFFRKHAGTAEDAWLAAAKDEAMGGGNAIGGGDDDDDDDDDRPMARITTASASSRSVGGVGRSGGSGGARSIRAPSLAMGQACCGCGAAVLLALLWDGWFEPARGRAVLSADMDWSAVAPSVRKR